MKITVPVTSMSTALHVWHFYITYLISVAVKCLSVSEGWGCVGKLGSCTAIMHQKNHSGLHYLGRRTFNIQISGCSEGIIFMLTDFIWPFSVFPPLDNKSRSFKIYWNFILFASLIINWNLQRKISLCHSHVLAYCFPLLQEWLVVLTG